MPKKLPIVNKKIFTKSFVSISKAAKFLQVSPDTLRNWERAGKLLPSRTYGGARRYSTPELFKLKKEMRPFVVRKKGLLTVSQASKALKVSLDTIRNWDEKGLIESTRSKGGARRFTREEISRLQKELGIESNPQPVVKMPVEIPKSSQRIHSFGSFWLKTTYSLIIILIILASGWFIDLYIEPLEEKIDEISKLTTEIIGSVESLQKGVLGIQTQPTPAPIYLPSNLQADISSAKAPIMLDSAKGEISCASCLTDLPDYISSVTSPDGALSIGTIDKKVTVSLDLGHSNTWSAAQTFNGGFYASATGDGYAAIFNKGNVGIGWTSPINKLEVAGGQTIGAGYAGTYKAPANGLLVQGNVGIGVTAPSYPLDVGGGARFACGNNNWDSGPATDCSDIAEVYQSDGSISVGEIVTTSQQADVVTRSVQPYQKNMIGVYSTSPALLVGGQAILGSKGVLTGNKIPVALTGRVPVKVSGENGPIEIGDYLTSSSIPGVAMKATRIGPVIGQALESFDVDIKLKFKNILTFVNVSYVDPGNFFASLNLDDQGDLIIPKIRATSIILEPASASASASLAVANNQLAFNTDPKPANTTYELTNKIASLGDRIEDTESKIKDLEAQIYNNVSSNTGNVGIGVTAFIEVQDLTPPDILLATASADLVNLSVKGTLSSDKLFTAQDIKTSGNLHVFGNTTLASTYIAGDLVVDGTFSINGQSVNVIGSPKCTEGGTDCGILFIQNSPLAYLVDFFNGLVTIDKSGNFKAQTITVAEFRAVAGKISGSGKISEGSKSAELENPLVKSSSRILITPTSKTNLVLAVTDKSEGKKFTVSVAQTSSQDIIFDWFLINESP